MSGDNTIDDQVHVCASAGNYGLSVAAGARVFGDPIEVARHADGAVVVGDDETRRC